MSEQTFTFFTLWPVLHCGSYFWLQNLWLVSVYGFLICTADDWFAFYGVAFIFLLSKSSSNARLWCLHTCPVKAVEDVTGCCLGFSLQLSQCFRNSCCFPLAKLFDVLLLVHSWFLLFFFMTFQIVVFLFYMPNLSAVALTDLLSFSASKSFAFLLWIALWCSSWFLTTNSVFTGDNPGLRQRTDIQG